MEKTMQEKLNALMKEWKAYSKDKWPGEPFVSDGAFPQYEKQKIKILFIARESYGSMDSDYWTAWQQEEFSATDNFHSRLLYLAYGILNGKSTPQDWIDMPEAEKLNRMLAVSDNFSFAFINASKLNNNSGSKNVYDGAFADFINDSKNQDYLLKEIEILNPDIIISGNLGDMGMMTSLLKKKVLTVKDSNEDFLYYKLTINGKRDPIPLLDGWHFSARKSTFENFYKPICSKAKEILKNKK